MALAPRKPVYDPSAPENRYPKMLYRTEGQKTGGVPVQNEEEHLTILTRWEDEDRAEKAKPETKDEPAKDSAAKGKAKA